MPKLWVGARPILVSAVAALLVWGCTTPTLPATPQAAPSSASAIPAAPSPTTATAGPTPVATTGGPLSPGTGANPCRLVTQAEVQQAAALPFAVGLRDGSDCDFVGVHDQGNDMTIVVSTDNTNNIGGARLAFADGHTVTGLGNDAWWSPSITELWVDLGNGGTLQVQIIPIGSPVDQDYFPIAQALAKIALSRL